MGSSRRYTPGAVPTPVASVPTEQTRWSKIKTLAYLSDQTLWHARLHTWHCKHCCCCLLYMQMNCRNKILEYRRSWTLKDLHVMFRQMFICKQWGSGLTVISKSFPKLLSNINTVLIHHLHFFARKVSQVIMWWSYRQNCIITHTINIIIQTFERLHACCHLVHRTFQQTIIIHSKTILEVFWNNN